MSMLVRTRLRLSKMQYTYEREDFSHREFVSGGFEEVKGESKEERDLERVS